MTDLQRALIAKRHGDTPHEVITVFPDGGELHRFRNRVGYDYLATYKPQWIDAGHYNCCGSLQVGAPGSYYHTYEEAKNALEQRYLDVWMDR